MVHTWKINLFLCNVLSSTWIGMIRDNNEKKQPKINELPFIVLNSNLSQHQQTNPKHKPSHQISFSSHSHIFRLYALFRQFRTLMRRRWQESGYQRTLINWKFSTTIRICCCQCERVVKCWICLLMKFSLRRVPKPTSTFH